MKAEPEVCKTSCCRCFPAKKAYYLLSLGCKISHSGSSAFIKFMIWRTESRISVWRVSCRVASWYNSYTLSLIAASESKDNIDTTENHSWCWYFHAHITYISWKKHNLRLNFGFKYKQRYSAFVQVEHYFLQHPALKEKKKKEPFEAFQNCEMFKV